MTTVSIVIMAHPKREEWAYELSDRLGCPIVFDENPEPTPDPERRWMVGTRAWEAAAAAGTEWSAVIQDDALVCRDFIPGFARALAPFDRGGVVSAYMGTAKTPSTTRAIQQIGRSSWAHTQALNWGVCFAVPTSTVSEMLHWCSMPERGQDNYDYRIGKFYRDVKGWRTYYTSPSLVDHRDEGSLVGHGAQTRRVAHNFLGEDRSALEIDWSKAPAVGFNPTIAIPPPYENPYRRRRVQVR